jgi:hypothetical protein
MQSPQNLDPVFAADRERGSAPPASGEASGNVVGRPRDEGEHAIGFHERSETPDLERAAFSETDALAQGGSFDGLGLPVADDAANVVPERSAP